MRFVHLGLLTEFSITESIIRIPAVVKRAVANQMPALAITDLSNLHATIKFYNECRSQGVKPIIGSQIRLDNPEYRVNFLAMNEQGFKNLREIVSRGYHDGKQLDIPCVQSDWIFQQHEGLIVLMGVRSPLGQMLAANNLNEAEQCLKQWLAVFGDRFYFALSRTNRPQEEEFIRNAVYYAEKYKIGVVADNDVHFLDKEDFEAHEARTCIADGYTLGDQRRPKNYTPEQYFKTHDEMSDLFTDIPSAIENTYYIALRCNVELKLGKYFLPDYPIPEGFTMDTFFNHVAQKGLEERLNFLYPVEQRDEYWADIRKPYDERLEYEVKTILQMGFPGYFLIVMDFIQWAKNNGVPVGPGRGSGAGSLVAYSLKITDLDPLRYELLFERFLNPERVSMPDFDVDFCIAGRDRVINYVAEKYGRESVSQIATFGTMAAKGVIKDVARVLGKSYGLADRMSKLVPAKPGTSLQTAYNEIAELRGMVSDPANPDYNDANEIWEMGIKLEGITRNTGKHAGGVVISPGKITDFSAITCEVDGTNLVTQYDKDDVESAGLVKFDFLGLRNLTVIDEALATINHNRPTEKYVDITRIPLNDPKAYRIFADGKTTAVFQFESMGMKRMLREARPSKFDEIIAFVSLYRPGPMDLIPDFISRMQGQKFEYLHSSLEGILKPTYGIMVYQEQVMQTAQIFAGYTLGGADLLRRAMGKKKVEEMEKQRSIFIANAIQQGRSEQMANEIFNYIEKFAGYGFNKSHAAAYALVAYQTAWLKAYYPAEFMAAVLSSEMTNTDTVVFLIDDSRGLGLSVSPPSINKSMYRFTTSDEKNIIYGLGAIKGVGESAMQSVIEARQKDGEFKDLFDFCHRVDMKKINKRTLESLIKAGAFDCFNEERSSLMQCLPEAMQAAEQARQNREMGMMDLFGEVKEVQHKATQAVKAWTDEIRLQGEKDTLGLYLTGHPVEIYRNELKNFIPHKINEVMANLNNKVSFAGLIFDIANFPNRVVIRLDDGTARLDVNCNHERFQRFKSILKENTVVVIEGILYQRDDNEQAIGQLLRAFSLDEIREKRASSIQLTLNEHYLNAQTAKDLKQIIQPFCQPDKKCIPLILKIHQYDISAKINLATTWKVFPAEALIAQLREYFGKEPIEIGYIVKPKVVERNYTPQIQNHYIPDDEQNFYENQYDTNMVIASY